MVIPVHTRTTMRTATIVLEDSTTRLLPTPEDTSPPYQVLLGPTPAPARFRPPPLPIVPPLAYTLVLLPIPAQWVPTLPN